MNPKLFSTLVEKEIISVGTNVEANYMGRSLDGTLGVNLKDEFIITDISKRGDGYVIILEKERGTVRVRATPESILNVDGMTPKRLGDIFNIKEDGTMKKVKLDEFGNPVRRGRKPKNRNVEVDPDDLDDFDDDELGEDDD